MRGRAEANTSPSVAHAEAFDAPWVEDRAGPFDARKLVGLSVYQDIVLDGSCYRPGVRDCEARWQLIEPHLPRAGAVLDVGSNFGWFGLRIASTRPQCVVASVEGDLRAAAVQRDVLASHRADRIALLTDRLDAKSAARWGRMGQRFAATLCLSVLHWMPDHRQFLTELGRLTEMILIECPAPIEQGVGLASAVHEMRDMRSYLSGVFAGAAIECLGHAPGLGEEAPARAIWQVRLRDAEPSLPGLALDGLLSRGLSWPRRRWWLEQCDSAEWNATLPDGWWLTPAGLTVGHVASPTQRDRLRRRLRHLPEETTCTSSQWLRRKWRGVLRRVLSTRWPLRGSTTTGG